MTGGVELVRMRASKPSMYVGSNRPETSPVIMNSSTEFSGFSLLDFSLYTENRHYIYRMEELEEMKKMV